MPPSLHGPLSSRQSSCPVLVYHLIDPEIEDNNAISPAVFAEHIITLSDAGYSFEYPWNTPVDVARKRILLTFDDAYTVTVKHAHDFLCARNIPYVVFVPTNHVGHNNLWNPKARYVTHHLSWPEIRRLAGDGVAVGSHCCSHHSLVKFDCARIREELSVSRTELELQLGGHIFLVAYPYGDVTAEVAEIASQYYEIGFSVTQGSWDWRANPLAINRVQVTRELSPQALLARIKVVESPLSVVHDYGAR
jgi:peptidoglycan/xylan/chitin deacetylase (PgdA/CDA1 family)